MLLLLCSLFTIIPFNTALVYPGNQEGKGTVETSFGCISAGNTPLDVSGNMQILTAAYSSAGELLWKDSVYWEQSTEIITIDACNDLIVYCGSTGNQTTSEDALAYAVNLNCQEQWVCRLALNLQERFTSAACGPGANIVCAGSTNSIGAGGNDVLLVEIDQNGDPVWTQTFGTEGEEAVYHISECSDGGYIMACQTMDWGAGLGDYWIIRTDSRGDSLWTGTYGGPEFDYPWRVIQNGDFFYVAGNTLSFGEGSYDWWILKLDSSGNVIWSKTWGYENTDTCMALENRGTGVIVAGMSEQVLNMFQATAVIFDENGSVTDEWFFQPGMIRSVHETPQGNFLFGGSTVTTDEDIWTMCTDSAGNTPQMGFVGEDLTSEPGLLANPVSSVLSVELPESVSRVSILDLSGRVVKEADAQSGCVSIDVSRLPSGVYTLTTDTNSTAVFAVLR